jgi:hypothetical protein
MECWQLSAHLCLVGKPHYAHLSSFAQFKLKDHMNHSDAEIVYTKIQDACSGEVSNELYMAVVLHELVDPNETSRSFLVRGQITSSGLQCTPLMDGTKIFSDYISKFQSIARDLDNNIYVTENNGFIVFNAHETKIVNLRQQIQVKGITTCMYVRENGGIVFGTFAGEVIHFDAGIPERVQITPSSAGSGSINRIHGNGSDFIVAVGNNGLVAIYKNGQWEKVPTPSNARLEAVWCKSNTEIYIGGWEGHVWRWNGDARWEPINIDFNNNLDKFYVADFAEYQDTIYAACVKNGIYRLNGDRLQPVSKVSNEVVNRLRVTNCGLIGLGSLWGDAGRWFVHFDGNKWTAEQVTLTI